jgi:hypothetical protein
MVLDPLVDTGLLPTSRMRAGVYFDARHAVIVNSTTMGSDIGLGFASVLAVFLWTAECPCFPMNADNVLFQILFGSYCLVAARIKTSEPLLVVCRPGHLFSFSFPSSGLFSYW